MGTGTKPINELVSTLYEDRLHYMDLLRGLLMMLGVVFHTSKIFSAGPWLVQDTAQSNWFFDFTVAVIQTFRMPAFFVIAGFFAAFVLARRTAGDFIRRRMLRLALPFLMSAVFINGMQVYLTHPGNPLDAWLGGRWLSHLWFLGYLIVYTWIAVLVQGAARSRLQTAADWIFRSGAAMAAVLLVVPVLALIARQATRFVVVRVWPRGLDTVDDLPVHLVFFLFGMLWCWSGKQGFPVPLRVLALATLLGVAATQAAELLHWQRAARVPEMAAAFWSALFCIACAMRWLNRPTRVSKFLAESSYTVYLFHQLFVVSLGILLLPLPVSAFVKAPLIMALVLAFTFGIHGIFRQAPLLSLLFNGRTYRQDSSAGAWPRILTRLGDLAGDLVMRPAEKMPLAPPPEHQQIP